MVTVVERTLCRTLGRGACAVCAEITRSDLMKDTGMQHLPFHISSQDTRLRFPVLTLFGGTAVALSKPTGSKMGGDTLTFHTHLLPHPCS